MVTLLINNKNETFYKIYRKETLKDIYTTHQKLLANISHLNPFNHVSYIITCFKRILKIFNISVYLIHDRRVSKCRYGTFQKYTSILNRSCCVHASLSAFVIFGTLWDIVPLVEFIGDIRTDTTCRRKSNFHAK